MNRVTHILSLGSVNADFQVRISRRPDISETLLGRSLARLSGGKAANVAFLARKLDHEARLFGHGDRRALSGNRAALRSVGSRTQQARRAHGQHGRSRVRGLASRCPTREWAQRAYAGLLSFSKEHVMQMNEIKQGIDRVEQCADEAERAMQSGSVPADLRQSVDAMHQQARHAQQLCGSQQQQGAETEVRSAVMQLEQAGDRAMQACRQAGSVDTKLQQAVQRAHSEASNLKKQVQMG
jgi:hypothetical protein